MKITENYLRTLYSKIIKNAIIQEKKGRIHLANRCLHASSYLAYNFFLSYNDENADKLIKRLSSYINRCNNYTASNEAKRCVFFDSSNAFNGGLKLQYLKAINAAGWAVLYFTDNDMTSWRQKQLYDFLKNMSNVEIAYVPPRIHGKRKLQYMYDTIINYHPSKLFIHVTPYAPYYMEVCAALPQGITRYLINYTDHSFILGSAYCDYSFIQGNYGGSVSCKWRKMSIETQFLLPFYPNMVKIPFQGLPEVCKEKIIIFSGGNMWKILDEEETFFKLSKELLENIPNSIIVYAGGGQSGVISKLLRKYNIDDRFILLGWRDDIVSLFETCDLYLSTYPAVGGLMSTYACLIGKPILALAKDDNSFKVENVVCTLGNYSISKYSIADVVKEAKKLLRDNDYYNYVIKQLKAVTVTEHWFNSAFKNTIESNKNCGLEIKIDKNAGNLQHCIDNSIAYHNKSKGWIRMVSNNLGLQAVTIDLSLFVPLVQSWYYMNFRFFVKNLLVKMGLYKLI